MVTMQAQAFDLKRRVHKDSFLAGAVPLCRKALPQRHEGK
jgi:hypothetical protein